MSKNFVFSLLFCFINCTLAQIALGDTPPIRKTKSWHNVSQNSSTITKRKTQSLTHIPVILGIKTTASKAKTQNQSVLTISNNAHHQKTISDHDHANSRTHKHSTLKSALDNINTKILNCFSSDITSREPIDNVNILTGLINATDYGFSEILINSNTRQVRSSTPAKANNTQSDMLIRKTIGHIDGLLTNTKLKSTASETKQAVNLKKQVLSYLINSKLLDKDKEANVFGESNSKNNMEGTSLEENRQDPKKFLFTKSKSEGCILSSEYKKNEQEILRGQKFAQGEKEKTEVLDINLIATDSGQSSCVPEHNIQDIYNNQSKMTEPLAIIHNDYVVDSISSPVNSIGVNVREQDEKIQSAHRKLQSRQQQDLQRWEAIINSTENDVDWDILNQHITDLFARKRVTPSIKSILTDVENQDVNNIIDTLNDLSECESLSSYDIASRESSNYTLNDKSFRDELYSLTQKDTDQNHVSSSPNQNEINDYHKYPGNTETEIAETIPSTEKKLIIIPQTTIPVHEVLATQAQQITIYVTQEQPNSHFLSDKEPLVENEIPDGFQSLKSNLLVTSGLAISPAGSTKDIDPEKRKTVHSPGVTELLSNTDFVTLKKNNKITVSNSELNISDLIISDAENSFEKNTIITSSKSTPADLGFLQKTQNCVYDSDYTGVPELFIERDNSTTGITTTYDTEFASTIMPEPVTSDTGADTIASTTSPPVIPTHREHKATTDHQEPLLVIPVATVIPIEPNATDSKMVSAEEAAVVDASPTRETITTPPVIFASASFQTMGGSTSLPISPVSIQPSINQNKTMFTSPLVIEQPIFDYLSNISDIFVSRLSNLSNHPILPGVAAGDIIPQSLSSLGLWVKGSGTSSRQRGNKDLPAFKNNQTSLTIGFDFQPQEDLILGLAYTLGQANTKLKEIANNKQRSIIHTGTAYGKYNFLSGFSIDGHLQYARSVIETKRNPYKGNNQIATGRASGDSFRVGLNAAYDINYTNHFHIIPKLGMYFDTLAINGFKEIGRAINITAPKHNTNRLSASGGISFKKYLELGNEAYLIPEIHTNLNRALLAKRNSIITSFAKNTQILVIASQGNQPKITYNAGSSISILDNRNTEFSAGYDYYFRPYFRNHCGHARIEFRF